MIGLKRCLRCGTWISMDEMYTHACVTHVDNIVEKLNYIHSVFQELEGQGISLPMGDFNLMYDILEDIRDDFELEKIFKSE